MHSRGVVQRAVRHGVAASFVLALIFAAAAPAVLAQGARLLGETKLAFHENDLDVLNFGACQNVTAIKLRAVRGAAEINLLVVKYGNGEVDRLPMRHRIPQGGETRWIDLRGARRCVTSIAVVGDTERSADRTIIQFWGR